MVTMFPIQATVTNDTLVIIFRYEAPCTLLRYATFKEQDWCDRLLNISFYEPLERFCTNEGKPLTYERHLFLSKNYRFKRENYLLPTVLQDHPQYFTTSLYSQRMFEKSINKLAVASLAAQLLSIKTLMNKIGKNWIKGKLDNEITESPYIAIEIPKTRSLTDYRPLSCSHDLNCKTVTLELTLKITKPKGLVGLSINEEILILSVAKLCLFTIYLIYNY